MIKAKLIVVGGDAKRTEVNLKKLPATIGRARDAEITLPHSLVSRKHCEIFERNDQLCVRDLDSLNGTYLNNEKIQGEKTILPGQLLTLGNVTFRADYDVIGQAVNGNQAPEISLTTDFQKDDTCDVGLEILSGNELSPEMETEHAVSPLDSTIPAENFVFDDVNRSQDASVSIGALEQLPSATEQASFSGQIDGEDPSATVDSETVQIDLGDQDSQDIPPSESALQDFFRKMPR